MPTGGDSGPTQDTQDACESAIAQSSCADLEGQRLPMACNQTIGFTAYTTQRDWCLFVERTRCQIDVRCGIAMPEEFIEANPALEGATCNQLAEHFCRGTSTDERTCATTLAFPVCIDAASTVSCDGRAWHDAAPSACDATLPGIGYKSSRGWCREVLTARCRWLVGCEGAPLSICDRPQTTAPCNDLEDHRVCVNSSMGQACINAIGLQACALGPEASPIECRTFPLQP